MKSNKLSVTLDKNCTVPNTANTVHTAYKNMNVMSHFIVNQHMPQAHQLVMLHCSVYLSLHPNFPFSSFKSETKVTSGVMMTISYITSKEVEFKIQNCSQHSQLRT
jgi:hypothetical protein